MAARPEDERIARLPVAFVVDQLGGGGGQRSMLITASAWVDLGGSAFLVAAKDGPYDPEPESGLSVLVLEPAWPRPHAVVRFVLKLGRLIRQHGIAILIVSGFGLGRVALLAKHLRLIDCRIILVERNTLSEVLKRRYRTRLTREMIRIATKSLYRRSDAVVGVSNGVSRDLERTLRLRGCSITTIHNPLDVLSIRRNIEVDGRDEVTRAFARRMRPVIATMGRLVPEKGHGDLLRAFSELPKALRGTLLVLGDGPLRSELRDEAARLGLLEHVWMPGFVPNPWWLIARSDVFCLTSSYEGHPRALLEALACGTPIISTDCPSGPAEILEGVSGARLVPTHDVAAITSAIIQTLLDPRQPEADLASYQPESIARHFMRVAAEIHDDPVEGLP